MPLIYSEEKGKTVSMRPPRCCLAHPVSSLEVPELKARSSVRLTQFSTSR